MLFVISLLAIASSFYFGKKTLLLAFEVLLSLWLLTRATSLLFWQHDRTGATYEVFVTFQIMPVFFLSEAAICKVTYMWGEYRLAHI